MSDEKEARQHDPLDKLNRVINVGDTLIYATLLGRSAALRVGKVLKIQSRPVPYSRGQVEWAMTVQGIDDMSSGKPILQNKGVLRYPERALIVNPDELPEKYRQILSNV